MSFCLGPGINCIKAFKTNYEGFKKKKKTLGLKLFEQCPSFEASILDHDVIFTPLLVKAVVMLRTIT